MAGDFAVDPNCEFGLLEWLEQVSSQLPPAADTGSAHPGIPSGDSSFVRMVLLAVPPADLSQFMNDVVARAQGLAPPGYDYDPLNLGMPAWTADDVVQWMGENPNAASFMKDSFNELLRPLVDPLTTIVQSGGPLTIRVMDIAQFNCHLGLYCGEQLLAAIEDSELTDFPFDDLPPDLSIEFQPSPEELAEIARQLAELPLLLDRVVFGLFRFAPGTMPRGGTGTGNSPGWAGQLPDMLADFGQRTNFMSAQLPAFLLKAIAANPSCAPTLECPDSPSSGATSQWHRWQLQISAWLKQFAANVDELMIAQEDPADQTIDDSETPSASKRAQAAGVLDDVISGIQDFTSDFFGEEAIYVEPRLGLQELIFGGSNSSDVPAFDPSLHWSAAIALVLAAEVVHRRQRRSAVPDGSNDTASSSRRRSSSLTGIWESGLSDPNIDETDRNSSSTSPSQWIRFGPELAPTMLNLQS